MNSAFFNLESGVFAISTPVYPDGPDADFAAYQQPPYAPIFKSALLNPPEAPATMSKASRRYIRSILTMQYYIIEWMYGFNLVGTLLLYQARNVLHANGHGVVRGLFH